MEREQCTIIPESNLEQVDFWVDGVLTVIISIIGILGNMLTIVVFNRKEIRSTFHTNLSILAFFDLGYSSLAAFNSILKMNDRKIVHDIPCYSEKGSGYTKIDLYFIAILGILLIGIHFESSF